MYSLYFDFFAAADESGTALGTPEDRDFPEPAVGQPLWFVPAVHVDPQGAPGVREMGGQSRKCPPGQTITCVSFRSAENGKIIEILLGVTNKHQ